MIIGHPGGHRTTLGRPTHDLAAARHSCTTSSRQRAILPGEDQIRCRIGLPVLFLVNLIYFLYIRSYISCELGRRPSLHSYISFLNKISKSYIQKVYKTAPKAPFSQKSRISVFFRPKAEKLIYKKYIRPKSLIYLLYISFQKSYI